MIFQFYDISVSVTFQFWWHFSFGYISVLVIFQFWLHFSFLLILLVMVNVVPWEVPQPKPSGFGLGTSQGTTFTMIPPRLFQIMSKYIELQLSVLGCVNQFLVTRDLLLPWSQALWWLPSTQGGSKSKQIFFSWYLPLLLKVWVSSALYEKQGCTHICIWLKGERCFVRH